MAAGIYFGVHGALDVRTRERLQILELALYRAGCGDMDRFVLDVRRLARLLGHEAAGMNEIQLMRYYLDAAEQHPQAIPGWSVTMEFRSHRRFAIFTRTPTNDDRTNSMCAKA